MVSFDGVVVLLVKVGVLVRLVVRIEVVRRLWMDVSINKVFMKGWCFVLFVVWLCVFLVGFIYCSVGIVV